jgi:hypothetical protein
MAIPKNDAHVHRYSENAISASSEDFNPPEKTLKPRCIREYLRCG